MNEGFVKAGLKILIRRFFKKNQVYLGSPNKVCDQIIDKCWNGKFYQTGLGHFTYFWVRDFGVVTRSLIAMGNTKRVHETLDWALENYLRADRITLCIDKQGCLSDAPKESIDALPWLLYSIAESGYTLNEIQIRFLEKEIRKFNDKFIDQKTGDILPNVPYSELRDAVNYTKSSYSVLMIYLISHSCHKLRLYGFIHKPAIYKKLLGMYWNGKYFDSDINNAAFSAESNLLPFVLGAVKNKEKMNSVFEYISERKINHPFPMRYTDDKSAFKYHWWGKILMPNYAGSTIWTWMGALYIQLLKQYRSDDFKEQFDRFSNMIKANKNFPELLHPNGEWYESALYRGDEGMVWAALYLETASRGSRTKK